MRRWGSRIVGFAGLLALMAGAAGAADAPKEPPGQAQVLHVTYYFLPG
jgi:hypothetical protein